jgi:hypothetical protein
MAGKDLLVVVGLGATLATPAWAAPEADCGCRPRTNHAVSELGRHKSSFAGRVTDVREEGGSRIVSFDVFRVWKGPREKQLSVKTDAAPDGCGYAFESGQDYLVYADGNKGALTTDRCADNAELPEAARAVRQLDLHTGRGATPLRVPERASVDARR